MIPDGWTASSCCGFSTIEHKGDAMMALKGIRVLDLTRLAPGPFCTMLLGLSGSPDKSGEASSGPLPARSVRRLSGAGPYYSLSPPLAIPKIGYWWS